MSTVCSYLYIFYSFAANVADRPCHSRLLTSPISDLDHLPNPVLSPTVVFKVFLVLKSQIMGIPR